MFGNMTIGKKLFLTIGAALTASLVMGVLTFVSLSRVGAGMDRVVNNNAKGRYLANLMYSNLTEMISLERGMTLKAIIKDQASVDKYHEDYRAELTKLTANLTQFSPLVKTPEGQAFVETITSSSSRLADFNEQLYQKDSNHDVDGALALLAGDFIPFANQLQARANTIADLQNDQMAKEAAIVKSIEAQSFTITTLMLLVCAAVGVVVVLIVFGINRSLLATATSLSDGAAQISAAATQVSSSSQSLAQGATEQAAAIEETSASAEEINSMARRSTDSSRATAELVAESQQRVEMANQNLEDMVVAMNDLTESSGKISKIIRVIDEIAFQTNILALNAAVEAARAGEAGMGFAVVAEEVRNLAQRSAQAAKDTAALIEDSITKTSSSKHKVDQVAVTMRAITEESGRIKVLVDGVSQGSEEQSRGIEQIGKAITQIEKVTQNAAANSEESAAAAEELSAQSDTLRELIFQLRMMVTTDDNASTSAVASMSRPQAPRRETSSSFRASTSIPAVTSVKTAFAGKGSLGLHRRDDSQRSVKRDVLEEEFQDF
jgi:methyl-accepting chemotaxis protein